MLNHIAVDGFRSLMGFNIFLQKGLNVVVGSNGTGKSNFITFLDFLGEMIDGDLNSAIAVAQGAGSVFSKERFDEEKAEFTFLATGQMSTESLNNRYIYYSPKNDKKNIDYSYTCTVTYLKSVPSIFISYESLEILPEKSRPITIYRTTERRSGKFITECRMSPNEHPIFNGFMSWDPEISEKRVHLMDRVASTLRPESSVISQIRTGVREIAAISLDLTRFRSINIDPTLARKPTPVGTRTRISPVGEGLAGTLYSLQKGNYYSFDPYRPGRRFLDDDEQNAIYESIVSWCKEVNPNISDIRVELDFQEAQFKPLMFFHAADVKQEFSFNRISDGTVKWLGLVTVLYAEENLSIVEEPENFLHPFMQESFVALCRHIIHEDPYRTIILTTHSPTILDCCSAEELTIFELDEGLSRASRVANRTELAEKVKTSRFGLGYYYRTGGVYGEDSRTR
jgi:predicted ATPase